MFSVDVEGLDETRARLDAFPAALSAALAAKARDLASALVDRVKYDKLSGGALNAQSGALQASIAADVAADADGVSVSVGSEGDVKYAAIQEYGGKTSAHEILPEKGKALAFMIGGTLRFARSVHHPGSLIPARSYLGSALDDMSDDIVAGLASAADSMEPA
jgi:phage gpG-like protein